MEKIKDHVFEEMCELIKTNDEYSSGNLLIFSCKK